MSSPAAPEVKPRRRRWLFLLCAGLLLAGLGGWFAGGRQAIEAWQTRRTLAGAEAFLQANDLRSASLGARQALKLEPQNPRALKVMAAIAERLGSPEALIWQQQFCQAPGTPPEEWLHLARLAMNYGEIPIAESALQRAPNVARETALWHELAGAVSLRQQRWPEAQARFREALRRKPGPAAELNLAAVELISSDPAVVATARETTQKLARLPEQRLPALRTLLADARRRKQSARVHEIAEELAAAPGATLEDRLQTAEELHQGDPAAFRAAWQAQQTAAGEDAAAIAGLMRWMNARGLAAETVAWADRLPTDLRARDEVAMSLAEALAHTAQWDALSRLTAEGNWGGLEFLRHAFRARAVAGDSATPRGASFVAAWEPAVLATRGNYSSLSLLARLVEAWGWEEQTAEVLWLLASQPSGQRPALQALFKRYRLRGDTANLYRVARRILEIEPANPMAKNNVAMLALLLDRDLPTAYRLADELHAAMPRDPGITTTYAFSLIKRQRAAEAQEAMATAAGGDDPQLGFYRALILAAAGRRQEARPAWQAAIKAGLDLLPEEKTFAEKLFAAP